MNLFKYKYSCITDTMYSLALYLLYTNDDDLRNTFFFVGDTISDEVFQKLPHAIKFHKYDFGTAACCMNNRNRLRFKCFFRYFTKVFAQDHLYFSPAVIGFSNYTLLEDAPNIFSEYKNFSLFRSMIHEEPYLRTCYNKIYGPTYGLILGKNNQCENRLITQERDLESDLVRGKKYTLVNFQQMWRNASPRKQSLIKYIFSITEEDLAMCKSSKIILFTQPLIGDCGLTEEEQISIYDSYIQSYRNEILLKIHPRDTVDYNKYYPGVKILKTKAPMQLLSAMKIEFETAITVTSTAINSVPEKTKKVWIGSQIHEKVFKAFGNVKCPF